MLAKLMVFTVLIVVGYGEKFEYDASYDEEPHGEVADVANAQPIGDGEERGIYVDFIYNPNYYYELSVVKYMLNEILDYNSNVPFYYDYYRKPSSTKITVGPESLISSRQSVITIKPKLLKDILYNQDIFSRIYAFLYAYFQAAIPDSERVPEYDRYINFDRYSAIFNRSRAITDQQSKVVCRNDEVYGAYEGRVCVRPDSRYIASIPFTHEHTREYWETLLTRVSGFMNILLSETFRMDANADHSKPCYEILLRPEPDVRAVLLFGHKAVKSARHDDDFEFCMKQKDRILADVVLFKHRIFHALGVGHKYHQPSIMNFYTKPWQRSNAFYILPEDRASMNQCYGDDTETAIPSAYALVMPPPRREQRRRDKFVRRATDVANSELEDAFVTDFDRFTSMYANGGGGTDGNPRGDQPSHRIYYL